jgi:hypothetical protein
MRSTIRRALVALSLTAVVCQSCSQSTPESPFGYSFIKPLHLRRENGKPYSEYRAFYVLTEDFEPAVESAADVQQIRQALEFASTLSATYKVPWTHFIDASALAPAFISDDQQLKLACQSMIGDLKAMARGSDDCELHLHGPLNDKLFEYLRKDRRLRVPRSIGESFEPYRQRRSFFFQSFYRSGYRELVSSLAYGKSFLESAIYDDKQAILAFRPGGWDHGSNNTDTMLYFLALADAELAANSGLSTGNFGGQNWRVGNDPGRNLAKIEVNDRTVLEVSPTAGPGGYLNPVLPHDLAKLAGSAGYQMPVIVAVYHLAGLQKTTRANAEGMVRSDQELQAERAALERHFGNVARLAASKVLYPITLRELLGIISERELAGHQA